MTRLTPRHYAAALVASYQSAAAADRPQIIKNFLTTLVRRRAMKLLPRIVTQIQTLQDHREGLTRVHVSSATPIDHAAMTQALENILGRVTLSTQLEPDLMGGLRFEIGDRLIDGTLKRRLEQLHSHLSQA